MCQGALPCHGGIDWGYQAAGLRQREQGITAGSRQGTTSQRCQSHGGTGQNRPRPLPVSTMTWRGSSMSPSLSIGGTLYRRSVATVIASLFMAGLLAPSIADAKGSSRGGHSNGSHSRHSTQPRAAAGVPRDLHGRIARSAQAKTQFKKSHPCPYTGKSSGACPGYVVDHVTPLKRGGADNPSNMQWQTVQQAKEKDRTE